MESLTFVSLFIIGLSYGATACMFSCAPFLAPLLLTNGTTLSSSVRVVLPFSMGRVLSYTLIALISFLSAEGVKKALDDNSSIQLILGGFTIAIGFYLLYKIFKRSQQGCSGGSKLQGSKPKTLVGFFLLGSLVSLNPCAPIVTLIGLSASASSLFLVFAYGLAFGLGAVLIPFVFYTFFVGVTLQGLLREFKKYKKFIELFAASLLIGTGVLICTGNISL